MELEVCNLIISVCRIIKKISYTYHTLWVQIQYENKKKWTPKLVLQRDTSIWTWLYIGYNTLYRINI